jgi:hypothetical protein
MVSYFLAPEMLDGANKYHCPQCNQLQTAVKQQNFVKPPQHLLVILQRFHYDPVTQRAKKIMNPVEFTPTLQLPVAEAATDRMTTCEYELYGVLMHSGTSAQHGHYYSYARTSETDVSGSPAEWFCFNDSVVTPSRFEALREVSKFFSADVPYLLLYRRADLAPLHSGFTISPRRLAEVQRDGEQLAQEKVHSSRYYHPGSAWASLGDTRFSRRLNQALGILGQLRPFGTPPPTCAEHGWQKSGHYGF